MVPIPADAGAKVRGEQQADVNQCEIVTATSRDAEQPEQPAEETKMDETRKAEPAPAPQPAAQTQTPDPTAIRAAERERSAAITTACRIAKLPADFAEKLIREDISLEQAQSRIFAEIARRDTAGPSESPSGAVEVTRDAADSLRAGMENALLHRVFPKSGERGYELTAQGREFRGMRLARMLEASLEARGVRTRGLSISEQFDRSLELAQRGGDMSTSDFPYLLADVAGKVLRKAYEEAPATYAPISRQVFLPDFKDAKRLQLGEAPGLLEILEHGEVKTGTIGEGKEAFALKSYGRRIGITRKAIINDDTDAFGRIPISVGAAARRLESDLVWAQITANGNMNDGVALFEATTHKNYIASGAAIAIASLGAMQALMRKQTGLSGAIINLEPRYLVVPAALEVVARQYVTAITANAGGSVNPFAGRLQVIVEPRLDANSLVSWYMAADPSQVDILEHAYLEGENGPRVTSRVGFEVQGIEIKVEHDFAAKVIDHRGIYKQAGA
jgi:hypothetical protein